MSLSYQISMEFFLQVLAEAFRISVVKYQRYRLYLQSDLFMKIDFLISNIPKRLHSHIQLSKYNVALLRHKVSQ